MTAVFDPITVGIEFEVHGYGTRVLDVLYRDDRVGDDSLHPYHCSDYVCDFHEYGPDGTWTWCPQTDPTVSAEFPSKVLTYGSDLFHEATSAMERACAIGGADLSGDSGMHVHVAKPDLDGPDRRAHEQRLLRLFVRYQDDLDDIAQGVRAGVRGYNSPLQVRGQSFWTAPLGEHPGGYAGSWLDIHRHSHTFEFRLWNATAAAWRMELAVGLSVAMVRAAHHENVTESDPRSMEEVLDPYLDADTWSGLIRQRFAKGGLR